MNQVSFKVIDYETCSKEIYYDDEIQFCAGQPSFNDNKILDTCKLFGSTNVSVSVRISVQKAFYLQAEETVVGL